MMGSYFVLNPVLRAKVREFLSYASSRGALIYYDFNFRSTHRGEALKLRADIIENMEYADIVRGSTEDLDNMFGSTDPCATYKTDIEYYCQNMISTDACNDVTLFTPSFSKSYPVRKIQTVSTIGAGDNFNAGIVFGLIREDITKDNASSMTEAQWDRIVQCALDFSAHVCQSLDNSISKEFAQSYIGKKQKTTLFD